MDDITALLQGRNKELVEKAGIVLRRGGEGSNIVDHGECERR